MKRLLVILILLFCSGCIHKCPPTIVCPTPPMPRELPPLSLCIEQQHFKKGDSAGAVLKCLTGDLAQALGRIKELTTQLDAYRK